MSRIVGADGRSRAQVGGRSVPVGTLAELADELIAVHGQTDQLRLRAPARQRDSIDRFGGDDVARSSAPIATSTESISMSRQLLPSSTNVHVIVRAKLRFFASGLMRSKRPHRSLQKMLSLATEVGRLTHADALRSAAMSAHAGLAR